MAAISAKPVPQKPGAAASQLESSTSKAKLAPCRFFWTLRSCSMPVRLIVGSEDYVVAGVANLRRGLEREAGQPRDERLDLLLEEAKLF